MVAVLVYNACCISKLRIFLFYRHPWSHSARIRELDCTTIFNESTIILNDTLLKSFTICCCVIWLNQWYADIHAACSIVSYRLWATSFSLLVASWLLGPLGWIHLSMDEGHKTHATNSILYSSIITSHTRGTVEQDSSLMILYYINKYHL